jgi:ABC-2 type transport system permease protein
MAELALRPSGSLYLHVAVKSFQKYLAYRAANLAGIATNTFFGAIYVLIYRALFEGGRTVNGYTVQDAVTYAIIAQSLLMAMSAFGNRELSESIIRGQIVTDLSRPINFYLYWAALDLGRALYYLIFRGIPTYVIGTLLFGGRVPLDPRVWALFLVSIATGMCLSFTFRYIVSSLAFWTTDVRGILYLSNTFIMFFAGFIVPIAFFPAPLRAVAQLLPFQGLSQVPVNVYLGKVAGLELARILGLQVVWLAVFVLAGHWLLERMVRRLTVNGG